LPPFLFNHFSMSNTNKLNAREIKDQVSLVDLLSRLGFKSLRTSGQELLYFSMLRDSDTKPSFAVNDNLGAWYDHGQGKGGTIIDFGMAFWPDLSFNEVLEKIVSVSAMQPVSNSVFNEDRRKRSAVKIPHYEILEVKDLRCNPAITSYLQSRGIMEAAEGRLKEIYYYVEDQKKLRKHFFAAGWQNELGAWEVRNIYFKGCLGHKALSFIPGDSKRLAVFEGFMNYLSWLADNPFANDSVLVLNSLSLLQAGIRKAREFSAISLYLDHDKAGRQGTADFIKAVPLAIDCSANYEGYNDYNEKLVAGLLNKGLSR
jgi:hypothetical protein